MRKGILVVLMVMLLCGFGTAYATQPLTTDDATTQGLKGAKVEVGVSYGEKDELNVTQIPLKLTYGLSKSVDIEAGVPYTRWEIEDSSISEVGFSDVTLALKWRFYEGFVNLAVKPEVTLPTGDEDKALGTGKANYGATLIASKQIDDLTVNANLKYMRTNNNFNETDNVWTGLISAEYPIALVSGLKAVAEVGVTDIKDNLIATGGFVYTVTKGVDLSVAAGKTPELDWKLISGITWNF